MEMYWVKLILYASAPFVMLAGYDKLKSMGVFSPRCPECRMAMNVEDKTITEPTADALGTGMRTRTCPNCGYRDQRPFAIDKYEGTTHGQDRFGGVLRWKREDWKRVNADTLKRSEADSAGRKPPPESCKPNDESERTND